MGLVKDTYKWFGKRVFGLPGYSGFMFTDPLGQPADRNAGQILDKEYQGIVSACIEAIAEEFASTEHVFTKKDSKKPIESHALLRLIENPNPDLTKFELLEGHATFMEMVGESFWYFALGEKTGEPKEIYLIRPDRMKVIIDKEGNVVAYKVMKNAADGILMDPSEIYHHKRFNPRNAYRGIGTLQRALMYTDTEKFSTRFTRNFLFNNATPAGVLSLEGDISKEAYDEFRRRWKEDLSGTENAGKIAVVRGAQTTFTKIGLSLADVDLQKLRDLSEGSIHKMFRVPKPLLATSDDVGLGRSSIETLEYIFIKRTMEPKVKRLDDSIEEIARRYWKKDNIAVSHKNVIPLDKDYDLKRKEIGVDKWITGDEARIEEGLDPVGLNKFYRPINLVELDGVQSGAKKSVYKISVSRKKEIAQPEAKKTFDWDVTDKSENSPQELFRKATIEQLAVSFEKKSRKAIKAYLVEQEDKVLSTFGSKSATAKDFQTGLDEADENKKLVALLSPIMIALAMEIGQETLRFVGSDVEYVMAVNLEKMMQAHLEKMAYKFNDETISKLSKTLAEGFANGESNNQVKKRIREVYSDAKDWRNARVARNESHWLAVNSTEEAYKQTDFVQYKKWYANPGACEFCSSVDGTVERVGHPFFAKGHEFKTTNADGKDVSFIADYEEVTNAHLHPNCRCQLLPLDENKSFEHMKIKSVDRKGFGSRNIKNEYIGVRFLKRDARGRLKEVEPQDLIPPMEKKINKGNVNYDFSSLPILQ